MTNLDTEPPAQPGVSELSLRPPGDLRETEEIGKTEPLVRREEHLAIYRKTAEERRIKPVNGGIWVMVDGVEYRHFGEGTERVEANTDGVKMPLYRVEQVGTFDSNNGRLAFVDGEGRMWVGASTQQNYEALREAMYQRGGIWVPFSNGETPVDRETYLRLRDILTGKPAEQLAAERAARVEEINLLRKQLFGEAAILPDRTELYERVANRSEYQYVNTDALVDQELRPTEEVDGAGFRRRIYTTHGVTFAFKGREELPIYPTLSNSRAQFLGERPNWVAEEDFGGYIQALPQSAEGTDSGEHYVVNRTLLGVLDLAIKLGSLDESLPGLRDEVSRGIYSDRSLLLLDALIAADYVHYSFSRSADPNGESVVLLALMGNANAQQAVAQNVERMRTIDSEQSADFSRYHSDEAPLDPTQLIVVHATRYEPEQVGDGGYSVRTTFDASSGKVLRGTVHTSLNHKVASHMYGSWGDAGYVLISPFSSMIETNGLPKVLNTVDTYWVRDPGERLEFPDATLVCPGGETDGLYEIDGNKVKFRSEKIDVDQLRQLREYYGSDSDERFLYHLERSFFDRLSRYSVPEEVDRQWDFGALLNRLNVYLYGKEMHWGEEPALVDRLMSSQVSGTNLEQKISSLLIAAGAQGALTELAEDREEAVRVLSEFISRDIRSFMFDRISRIASVEAIRQRGFGVQPGGMWAWGDSWGVTAATAALGVNLGVEVMAHTNSIDHKLEEAQAGVIYRARAEQNAGEDGIFRWEGLNPDLIEELIPQLDAKSRRMVYASGLLVARS